MRTSVAELLSRIRAQGMGRRCYYMSTPITSGLREYELATRLGVASLEQLRSDSPSLLAEVKIANIRAALACEETFRRCNPGKWLVNPAAYEIVGFEQRHYDELWLGLLDAEKPTVVTAPFWEYSRGARLEIVRAFELGLDFMNCCGQRRPYREIKNEWDTAARVMQLNGWSSFRQLTCA